MLIHKKPVFALLLATLTYSQFNQMLKATPRITPIIDVVKPKEESLQNSLPQPEPIHQQEEATVTTLVIPQDETVATASTLTTKQKVLIGAGVVATAACLAGAGYLIKDKIPFLKNKKNQKNNQDDSDKNSLPIIPSYQEQDQQNNDIPEQDIEIPNNDNEISYTSEHEDQESQCSYSYANTSSNTSDALEQNEVSNAPQSTTMTQLSPDEEILEKISKNLKKIKIISKSQFDQTINNINTQNNITTQTTNTNNIKNTQTINTQNTQIATKNSSSIGSWLAKIRNTWRKTTENKDKNTEAKTIVKSKSNPILQETIALTQQPQTKTLAMNKQDAISYSQPAGHKSKTGKNRKNIIARILAFNKKRQSTQEKKALAQQRQQDQNAKKNPTPKMYDNEAEWKKGIQERKAIAQQRQQAHKIKSSKKAQKEKNTMIKLLTQDQSTEQITQQKNNAPVPALENHAYAIHALANKIGVTSEELIKLCQELNIPSTKNKKVNDSRNWISAAYVQTLYNELH